MTNKNFFIRAITIAILVLLIIISIKPFFNKQDSTFQVSEQASVFAKPNLAKIYLESIRESNSVTSIQTQLSQASNDLSSSLKKLKIQEQNIKTINYSISPKTSWNRETGESYIYGYRGNVQIEVKIKDFSKIDQVVNLGQVKNIVFEVENKDEFLAQARVEAMQKAKLKAKKIAQEAGISLGKLVNISISENQNNYLKYSGIAEMSSDESASIQVGENEIKIYVNLEYEIK